MSNENVRKQMEALMASRYTEMFTDEFIQNHSSFKSFQQLWENNSSKLKEKLSFRDYIKTEEWNEYIKEKTDFDDFVGMEFAAKINDFRTNKKHWFGDEKRQ